MIGGGSPGAALVVVAALIAGLTRAPAGVPASEPGLTMLLRRMGGATLGVLRGVGPPPGGVVPGAAVASGAGAVGVTGRLVKPDKKRGPVPGAGVVVAGGGGI